MAQHSHTNPSQCTPRVQRVIVSLIPERGANILRLTCIAPNGEALSASRIQVSHIDKPNSRWIEIIGEIVGKFTKTPFNLRVLTKIPATRENKSKFLLQSADFAPSLYGGLFIAHTLITAKFIETSGLGLRKTREILGDTPHGTPVIVHDYVCIHIQERRTP